MVIRLSSRLQIYEKVTEHASVDCVAAISLMCVVVFSMDVFENPGGMCS